jgi:hypothetical protein
VPAVKQEHVRLLSACGVSERAGRVAGHRQEDAPRAGEPLGDPPGQLGDRPEIHGLAFPFGFEDEPRAIQGERDIDLSRAADAVRAQGAGPGSALA